MTLTDRFKEWSPDPPMRRRVARANATAGRQGHAGRSRYLPKAAPPNPGKISRTKSTPSRLPSSHCFERGIEQLETAFAEFDALRDAAVWATHVYRTSSSAAGTRAPQANDSCVCPGQPGTSRQPAPPSAASSPKGSRARRCRSGSTLETSKPVTAEAEPGRTLTPERGFATVGRI